MEGAVPLSAVVVVHECNEKHVGIRGSSRQRRVFKMETIDWRYRPRAGVGTRGVNLEATHAIIARAHKHAAVARQSGKVDHHSECEVEDLLKVGVD